MEQCPSCHSPVTPGQKFCKSCGYDLQRAASYSTHLMPGTVLGGRYRIDGELGSGSSGVTYHAVDILLQFRVAIKEYFPADHAAREAGQSMVSAFPGEHAVLFADGKKRFMQEALILAKFQNEDGIVRILNVFEENGTAYMVMEYLEGETLESYLGRNGVLNEDAAIYVLTPLMQSLKAVHDAGILHRSISPDNIFMTMDGRSKLIGFGASRYATGTQSLTVMVRPGFSPEEQYGVSGALGPYTDVYAIAATLYRMITGKNPPDALERRSGIEKNRRDILEEPHNLNRNISQVRENAILNALNVDIRDRTPDIPSFLKELNADKPAARRYGSIGKINRFKLPLWMKIAVPAVLAAAVALIVLLATGVISFSRFSQNGKKPEGAVTVPEVEGMEKEKAVERIEKETLRAGANGAAVSKYVPAGKIVLQTPTGGSFLFPGDEVLLTVSRGEGVVKPVDGIATVPYVTWSTREEAVELLEEAGLGAPQIEEEYSDLVQEGSVISQSIEYGEKIEEGTSVTLVVSLGSETGELQGHHLGRDESEGSPESGAEDGASEPSEGSGEEAYENAETGNPDREGVRILSVMPDRRPQSADENLRVFVSVEYDLESSDEGWLLFYVKQGEEYVNKAGIQVKKGHGEENIDFGDVKAGELENYPVLAVLEDGDRSRLAEDEFDFNLLSFLDPTLVPGDGMEYVDMQISGRTMTVSLVYDNLKESYSDDRPGKIWRLINLSFAVRFYDGFGSYMVGSFKSEQGEEPITVTLNDLYSYFMKPSENGGGYEPFYDIHTDFAVEGTKMTWTTELPEEVYAENLLITGWEIDTPEETMYFYGDVADGIHRIPHTETEETEAAPESSRDPDLKDAVRAQGPPDGDYIRIVSVDPGTVTPGKAVYYTLTLAYSIESNDYGVINIGMDTQGESGFTFYNGILVERGSGTLQLGAEMEAPTEWLTSIHAILSEYPHPDRWDPITGDIRRYDMSGNPEAE